MLSAVIRLPCVRPYEVKHHLLNEGLSHFNCLHRDRERQREEGGKSDEMEEDGGTGKPRD